MKFVQSVCVLADVFGWEFPPANAYLSTDPAPLLAKALIKLHLGDEAKQLLPTNGTT